MGEARLKLTDIKPISSRLIRLEMNTIPRTTIICAYAPTSAHTDEAKDQFYDALQNEIDHTRRNRPLIVAGDFNARLHARNVDEHALLGQFIWKRPQRRHGPQHRSKRQQKTLHTTPPNQRPMRPKHPLPKTSTKTHHKPRDRNARPRVHLST